VQAATAAGRHLAAPCVSPTPSRSVSPPSSIIILLFSIPITPRSLCSPLPLLLPVSDIVLASSEAAMSSAALSSSLADLASSSPTVSCMDDSYASTSSCASGSVTAHRPDGLSGSRLDRLLDPRRRGPFTTQRLQSRWTGSLYTTDTSSALFPSASPPALQQPAWNGSERYDWNASLPYTGTDALQGTEEEKDGQATRRYRQQRRRDSLDSHTLSAGSHSSAMLVCQQRLS
jgi:hypothetical protein